MLKFKAIIFLIICLNSIVAFPTILYISPSKKLDIGNDATLTCQYDDIGENEVSWSRKDKNNKMQIISINDDLYIKDNRFTINNLMHEYGGNNAGMYTLNISNITENDNGTYECLIYLTVDKVLFHNSTTLYVFPNTIKNVVALQGDNVFLNCYDEYYPFNEIIWAKYYKDSLPNGSRTEDGVLIIPSTIIEDSGLYICKAEFYINNQLNEAIRNIKLEVIPPLNVQVRNNNVVRPEGHSVNLTCIIHSLYPVKVLWSKNNEIIYDDIRHVTQLYDVHQNSENKKNIKIAEMRITNLKPDDYGPYYCNVENQFGIENQSILLSQYL